MSDSLTSEAVGGPRPAKPFKNVPGPEPDDRPDPGSMDAVRESAALAAGDYDDFTRQSRRQDLADRTEALKIKKAAVWGALVFIGLLDLCVLTLLGHVNSTKSPKLSAYAQTALASGMFISTLVVLAVLLRGVFADRQVRNGENDGADSGVLVRLAWEIVQLLKN